MNKTIAFAAAALLLLSGVCNAQSLTTKEQAFVDALEQSLGEKVKDLEKSENVPGITGGTYTGIEVEFEDGTEVSIIRFDEAKHAFSMADQIASMSGSAQTPTLLEVRGKNLLMIEGALDTGTLAKSSRAAAWKNLPWAGAKGKVHLLQLNLLVKGLVTRIEKAEGGLYAMLEIALAEAKEDKIFAEANPNPQYDTETYELIGRTGIMIVGERFTTLLRASSKRAVRVVAPALSSVVLREFAQQARLPIPKASTSPGAAGAITGLPK